MRGHYVVFEGIDGSGKSTICSRIEKKLREKGYKVLCVSEPSDSKIGQLLKNEMKDITLNQESIALLYAADSYDIQKKITKEYDFILSDRCYYSTVAYQMMFVNEEWLFSIHSFLKNPDIVFYLDVPVCEALNRIEGREKDKEVFEDEKILKCVKNNYDKIMKEEKNNKIICIETSECSVNQVEEQVFNEFKRYFL